MAKKLLICFALLFISVAAVCLSINALDMGIEDDFQEISTDKSFMLDSPLFTDKYEPTIYTEPTEDELTSAKALLSEEGFEYVCSNNNGLELWHNEDGNAIRVLNSNTGYIWASDIVGLNVDNYNKAFLRTVQSAFELTYTISIGTGTSRTIQSVLNSVDVDYTVSGNTINYEVYHSASIPVSEDQEELLDIELEFEYSVTLTDTGIEVNMPMESVKETECSLTDITFFRYFGSVYSDAINGYIVIPNGNGGLIRYGSTSTMTSRYRSYFYGSDLNYDKDEDQLLSFPMYGMVHGVDKDACLVEINSGDSFAYFNYYPTGIDETNDYHNSYLSFELRRSYQLSIAAGSNVTVLPSEIRSDDINFAYTFLSGEEANYVGIAKEYQQHLVADGKLSKQELKDSTSVHIEAFGREYENGLIMKKYYNMTTVSDLLDIDEQLRHTGVSDVLYTLKGFYNGGYSASNPTKTKFDSHLGNIKDLNSLDYYMYYNPVVSISERLSYPSYVMVNVYREKTYTNIEGQDKYYFYSDVPTIVEGTNKVVERYGSKVSFDGITNYLYGDYNSEYDREDTERTYETLLGDEVYPMYAPNVYLLKNTSEYLAMDLYHERIKIVTDSVPLTQIILRGYMDLYSTYLNFSSNPDLDTLKCIEYGVYPAYLITEEPSHKLANTLSNDLYATEYSKVRTSIQRQYTQVKEALDSVVGAEIVDREVIALGVVSVEYSNGVSIIVNYTNDTYTNGLLSVKSMGCEVVYNG